MPLIRDEDIDEVRQRADIVDVISTQVQLKKAGRTFKGLCPFHDEKTPSFIVNPDRQTYHCFGCGEGGNVISFVMKTENLDFPDAVKVLADIPGGDFPRKPGQEGENFLQEGMNQDQDEPCRARSPAQRFSWVVW